MRIFENEQQQGAVFRLFMECYNVPLIAQMLLFYMNFLLFFCIELVLLLEVRVWSPESSFVVVKVLRTPIFHNCKAADEIRERKRFAIYLVFMANWFNEIS